MKTLSMLGFAAALLVGPSVFAGASAHACDGKGKKSLSSETACDGKGKKSLTGQAGDVSCDGKAKKSLSEELDCDGKAKKS